MTICQKPYADRQQNRQDNDRGSDRNFPGHNKTSFLIAVLGGKVIFIMGAWGCKRRIKPHAISHRPFLARENGGIQS